MADKLHKQTSESFALLWKKFKASLLKESYSQILLLAQELNQDVQESEPDFAHDIESMKKRMESQMNNLLQTKSEEYKKHNIDLDTMIDIGVSLLTTNIDLKQEMSFLKHVLQIGLQSDAKYCFMILSAKLQQVSSYLKQKTLIKKFKCLLLIPIFQQHYFQLSQQLFSDYLYTCQQLKSSYQQMMPKFKQINLDQQKEENENNLSDLYLRYCSITIGKCIQKREKERVIQVITRSFSWLLVNQKLPSQLFSSIEQMRQKLEDQTPSILLALLYQNNSTSFSLVSQVQCLKVLCQISVIIMPISIKSTQIGSLIEQTDDFLKKILRSICILLLNLRPEPSPLFMELYYKITIYQGFINHSQNQLYILIERILNVQQMRPIFYAKIWLFCLDHDETKKQVDYRIFCMSRYRKILHYLHRKGQNLDLTLLREYKQILSFTKKFIDQQLTQSLAEGIMQNWNYLSHLTSLIDNYIGSIGGIKNRQKLFPEIYSQVEIIKDKINKVKKIADQRLGVIENQKELSEAEITHIELVSFRIEQLNWSRIR